MGMMIVRHKVRDYGPWRPIFDQHAEIMPKCRRRRALSIHGSIILPIAPGPLMALSRFRQLVAANHFR